MLDASHDAGCHEFSSMERLVNGLWATILALGTVLTSITILHARSWRFFKVCAPGSPCPLNITQSDSLLQRWHALVFRL